MDPVLPGAVFMCSVERCDHTILCVEINYALENAFLTGTVLHPSDAAGLKTAGNASFKFAVLTIYCFPMEAMAYPFIYEPSPFPCCV